LTDIINFEILELGNLLPCYLILFCFAVLLAAVKIAVNSLASFNNGVTSSGFAFLVSGIISSQNTDSSASSSTTPIFATNSARRPVISGY
jgi:hypothetical protein